MVHRFKEVTESSGKYHLVSRWTIQHLSLQSTGTNHPSMLWKHPSVKYLFWCWLEKSNLAKSKSLHTHHKSLCQVLSSWFYATFETDPNSFDYTICMLASTISWALYSTIQVVSWKYVYHNHIIPAVNQVTSLHHFVYISSFALTIAIILFLLLPSFLSLRYPHLWNAKHLGTS